MASAAVTLSLAKLLRYKDNCMFACYQVVHDEEGYDMEIVYNAHTTSSQCLPLSEEAKAVVEKLSKRLEIKKSDAEDAQLHEQQ